MRRHIGIAVGFLLVVVMANLGWTTQNEEVKKAILVSEKWLTLIDEDKYSESWENASSYFRQNIEREEWVKKLKAVRNPLGRLLRRDIISHTYKTSLPGAPDGEYVVIQYNSSFEKKKKAIETVTPMKDHDGIWRIAGYYII